MAMKNYHDVSDVYHFRNLERVTRFSDYSILVDFGVSKKTVAFQFDQLLQRVNTNKTKIKRFFQVFSVLCN